MKNFIIPIVFIVIPMLSFSQNDPSSTTIKTSEFTSDSLEKTSENIIAVGTFSKTDVNNLSYKKSIELISIKAYRKSLQIKVKEVRSC